MFYHGLLGTVPALPYHMPMTSSTRDMVGTVPVFRFLGERERDEVARVATVQLYGRGQPVFAEGTPSEFFFAIVRGRVKVFKVTPTGKDVIISIFGPGETFGAVAVYRELDYPASVSAIEDCVCLRIRREDLFRLLETNPAMTRGMLTGLTQRLVELTNRISELTGGRVERRLVRLFLKLAVQAGSERGDATFVPLQLSRQELADLTCTTVETSIRIMSRWGKDGIVLTEDDGFLIADPVTLATLAGD